MPDFGLWRIFGAVYLSLGVVFLAYAAVSYVRRKSAGAVLLDLGPWPYLRLIRLGGLMWLALAVWQGYFAVADPQPDQRGTAALIAALAASFGISFLSFWGARRQFTEKGVAGENGVVPWGRISSCRWRGDRIVEFTVKRRFNSIKWKIAPAQKKLVEKLLAERLPPASFS